MESAAERSAPWTPEGLSQDEALERWRAYFAKRHETPVDVLVHEGEAFDAYFCSWGIGQLRMLHLHAPAQKVVHYALEQELTSSDHLIHLIYAIEGTFNGRDDACNFVVQPGQFLFLDNSRFFELDCTRHEVIDLIMPLPWLEQHLPDPLSLLGKPISIREGWAPPLASLLETVARQGEDCPVPRTLIADQLGSLIALAVGVREPSSGRRSARLAQQIMRRIESDSSDPDLSLEGVAGDLQISKRYLQSLLASSGTSFVRELNAVRLDRASAMLVDPRTRELPVSEVAFRCGFLDPAYFTRQFRKRFNATPRGWRGMNQAPPPPD